MLVTQNLLRFYQHLRLIRFSEMNPNERRKFSHILHFWLRFPLKVTLLIEFPNKTQNNITIFQGLSGSSRLFPQNLVVCTYQCLHHCLYNQLPILIAIYLDFQKYLAGARCFHFFALNTEKTKKKLQIKLIFPWVFGKRPEIIGKF